VCAAFGALTLSVGWRQGVGCVQNWVLVFWWFGWSFAYLRVLVAIIKFN